MANLFLTPQQQAVVEILQRTNGPVGSESLERELGLSREEVFAIVTDLMTQGVPVYVKSEALEQQHGRRRHVFTIETEFMTDDLETEVGSRLRTPDGPLMYRYAHKPEELYDLRVAVGDEAELMSDLHTGIENAQASFFPDDQLPDAPTLHTLYALGTMDSGTILMHFTRGGEPRTCRYRGFAGVDLGSDSVSDIELLDQCFASWDLSQLVHQLAWFDPFELQPSILLPIRSASEARLHIHQPRGGESIEIDLPPECGGPFVARGDQIESMPDCPRLDLLRHQFRRDRESFDNTKAHADR
jgi:predicted transcriptional regulator